MNTQRGSILLHVQSRDLQITARYQCVLVIRVYVQILFPGEIVMRILVLLTSCQTVYFSAISILYGDATSS